MKTILIVQARMNSSRLPGKILMPLVKKLPLIGVLLKRLNKLNKVDKVIVATSKNKENDILVNYLKEKNFAYFRGNENDTLKRFYDASKKNNAKTIIRITADCPLTDPKLIEEFFLNILNFPY